MPTKPEMAILAGGCFWGLQDLIRRYPGVVSSRVGYTNRKKCDMVVNDFTTCVQAVEAMFNSQIISFRQILEFFFQIHDPTTLNRQGPDTGTKYRSVIFYTNQKQKEIAEYVVAEVDASGLWPGKIVTEVSPAGVFSEVQDIDESRLERLAAGNTCHFIRPLWRLPVKARSSNERAP
jgi:peptide-methionine (S)-S-oxide reductase